MATLEWEQRRDLQSYRFTTDDPMTSEVLSSEVDNWIDTIEDDPKALREYLWNPEQSLVDTCERLNELIDDCDPSVEQTTNIKTVLHTIGSKPEEWADWMETHLADIANYKGIPMEAEEDEEEMAE